MSFKRKKIVEKRFSFFASLFFKFYHQYIVTALVIIKSFSVRNGLKANKVIFLNYSRFFVVIFILSIKNIFFMKILFEYEQISWWILNTQTIWGVTIDVKISSDTHKKIVNHQSKLQKLIETMNFDTFDSFKRVIEKCVITKSKCKKMKSVPKRECKD